MEEALQAFEKGDKSVNTNINSTGSDFDKKDKKDNNDGDLFSTFGNFVGMAYDKTVSVAGTMKDKVAEMEITKKFVDVSGKAIEVVKDTSTVVINKGTEVVKETTNVVVNKGNEVAVSLCLIL
jgi:hypothetical protein